MRLIISSASSHVLYKTETILLTTFVNRLTWLNVPAIEEPAIQLDLENVDTEENKQYYDFFKELQTQMNLNSGLQKPVYAACRERVNLLATDFNKAMVAFEYKKNEPLGPIVDYKLAKLDRMPEPVRLTYSNGVVRIVDIYDFIRMRLPITEDIRAEIYDIATWNKKTPNEDFIEELRDSYPPYEQEYKYIDVLKGGVVHRYFDRRDYDNEELGCDVINESDEDDYDDDNDSDWNDRTEQHTAEGLTA